MAAISRGALVWYHSPLQPCTGQQRDYMTAILRPLGAELADALVVERVVDRAGGPAARPLYRARLGRIGDGGDAWVMFTCPAPLLVGAPPTRCRDHACQRCGFNPVLPTGATCRKCGAA